MHLARHKFGIAFCEFGIRNIELQIKMKTNVNCTSAWAEMTKNKDQGLLYTQTTRRDNLHDSRHTRIRTNLLFLK